MEEGCLSIPTVTVKVKRPIRVVIQYINEHQEVIEREFSDLLARVIQHENDHLNGKLIIDYASLRERMKLQKQLKEIRKLSKEVSSSANQVK